MNNTVCINVGQVYSLWPFDAPKGWRFVGFRLPQTGDYYLPFSSSNHVSTPEMAHAPGISPRLIVGKIPVHRMVFESTGENRVPKPGEYIYFGGDIRLVTDNFYASCRIYERVENTTK